MSQVDRSTKQSSDKGGNDKTAVLPTENSPKKSAASQAKQDGQAKQGQADAAGRNKRSDGAKSNQR